MPPFGFERKLRIFIDPDLLQYDEVWAAAGTIGAGNVAASAANLKPTSQTLFVLPEREQHP